MVLHARRGRNQKGICFVSSSHSQLDRKVCAIEAGPLRCLADVRSDSRVPEGSVVIDSRLFDRLALNENDEVVLSIYEDTLHDMSQLVMSLRSTRGLDNMKVADAISKRVNDLREDFEGLILAAGDNLVVTRLDLAFSVVEVRPRSPGRVLWKQLESIRLVPQAGITPSNLVVVSELGGSSHIEDCGGAEAAPRYSNYLHFLDLLGESFSGLGGGAKFSGLGFSEEVHTFSTFDSETGEPSEVSFLESASVIAAYSNWVEELLAHSKRSTSNLGDAVSDAVRIAERIRAENRLPIAVVVLSSGVFSSGPNPVKTIRRGQGLSDTTFFFLYCGTGVQSDILEAMAEQVQGILLKIDSNEDISNAVYSLSNRTARGG